MEITAEQRTYARIAGILFLAHFLIETLGDYPTIIARRGSTFVQTAHYIAEHETLWRAALLSVAMAWVSISVLAFALFVVLEPVQKRLAQLALIFRLGGSFVGAASMMFRVAKAQVSLGSTAAVFNAEQLGGLAAVTQQAANSGVYIAWIFMGLGSTIFFALFLRSRYLPRVLAAFGLVTSMVLVAVPLVSFACPQYQGTLKVLLIPGLPAELATAFWLLIKGLPFEAPATTAAITKKR